MDQDAASVPEVLRTAGWIEFGTPRADVRCAIAPEAVFHQPEEGLMFVFPSYFYHRTVPFESEELRVSIAFDVMRDD